MKITNIKKKMKILGIASLGFSCAVIGASGLEAVSRTYENHKLKDENSLYNEKVADRNVLGSGFTSPDQIPAPKQFTYRHWENDYYYTRGQMDTMIASLNNIKNVFYRNAVDTMIETGQHNTQLDEYTIHRFNDSIVKFQNSVENGKSLFGFQFIVQDVKTGIFYKNALSKKFSDDNSNNYKLYIYSSVNNYYFTDWSKQFTPPAKTGNQLLLGDNVASKYKFAYFSADSAPVNVVREILLAIQHQDKDYNQVNNSLVANGLTNSNWNQYISFKNGTQVFPTKPGFYTVSLKNITLITTEANSFKFKSVVKSGLTFSNIYAQSYTSAQFVQQITTQIDKTQDMLNNYVAHFGFNDENYTIAAKIKAIFKYFSENPLYQSSIDIVGSVITQSGFDTSAIDTKTKTATINIETPKIMMGENSLDSVLASDEVTYRVSFKIHYTVEKQDSLSISHYDFTKKERDLNNSLSGGKAAALNESWADKVLDGAGYISGYTGQMVKSLNWINLYPVVKGVMDYNKPMYKLDKKYNTQGKMYIGAMSASNYHDQNQLTDYLMPMVIGYNTNMYSTSLIANENGEFTQLYTYVMPDYWGKYLDHHSPMVQQIEALLEVGHYVHVANTLTVSHSTDGKWGMNLGKPLYIKKKMTINALWGYFDIAMLTAAVALPLIGALAGLGDLMIEWIQNYSIEQDFISNMVIDYSQMDEYYEETNGVFSNDDGPSTSAEEKANITFTGNGDYSNGVIFERIQLIDAEDQVYDDAFSAWQNDSVTSGPESSKAEADYKNAKSLNTRATIFDENSLSNSRYFDYMQQMRKEFIAYNLGYTDQVYSDATLQKIQAEELQCDWAGLDSDAAKAPNSHVTWTDNMEVNTLTSNDV